MKQDSISELITTSGDSFISFLLWCTGGTGKAVLLSSLNIAARTNLTKIEDDTREADIVQTKLLEYIFRIQKDTKYGIQHKFAQIGINEFLSVCPLTTYDDYKDLIKEVVDGGKYSQLVSEPITLFQETSGTTGKVKLIPRTNQFSLRALQAFQAVEYVAQSHFDNLNTTCQKGLALVNTTPNKFTPAGIPRGTGTSGGLSDALKKFKLANDLVSIKYSSPPPVFLIPDSESAYYCHLLFGLLDRQVTNISANFAANVLEAVQTLERHWRQLTEDILVGRLHESLDLDVATRQKLQTYLQPNPGRAKELQTYFETGFEGILPQIWPRLAYVQCITTGSMQIYSDALRFYTGHVPLYSGGYAASEAWIGVNLYPERQPQAYVVTPNTAFFEFVPEKLIDQDQPPTVKLTALTVGESYEVVVTTLAGLYRYRLGDVVKCVGFHNKSPMIEFLYRRQGLLNLLGEKVSEDVVLAVLSNTFSDHLLIDYTCRYEYSENPWRYVIYLETKDSEGLFYQKEEIQHQMDVVLCRLSDRYRDLRATNRIGQLRLKLVCRGSFSDLKAKLLLRGYSDSQFKMPRLITDSTTINFLEARLLP